MKLGRNLFSLLLIALAFTCVGLAQTSAQPISLKGHSLGESFNSFYTFSTEDKIYDCKMNYQAWSSHVYDRHGKDIGTAGDLIAAGKFVNRAPGKPVTRPTYDCTTFMKVFNNETTKGAFSCVAYAPLTLCDKFDGSVEYQDDALVELMFVSHDTWENVLNSAKAKAGNPDDKDTRTEQNGFGATNAARNAIWTTPNYVLLISEHMNSERDMEVFVILQTRAHADAELKGRTKSTHSLD